MTETWKPVVGAEGEYEVSDAGRVRSVRRQITYTDGRSYIREGQTLEPVTTAKRYEYVSLGRGRRRYVHQMVLEAFAGPRPDGAVARHLDGDPMRNVPSNLAWGSPSENMHDRKLHGTDHYAGRSVCKNGHEYTSENTYVTARGARQCRACMAVYRARYEKKRRTS